MHLAVGVSSSTRRVLDGNSEFLQVFLDELGSRDFDIGDYAVDSNERGNLYADVEPLDVGVGLPSPVGVVGLSNSLEVGSIGV